MIRIPTGTKETCFPSDELLREYINFCFFPLVKPFFFFSFLFLPCRSVHCMQLRADNFFFLPASYIALTWKGSAPKELVCVWGAARQQGSQQGIAGSGYHYSSATPPPASCHRLWFRIGCWSSPKTWQIFSFFTHSRTSLPCTCPQGPSLRARDLLHYCGAWLIPAFLPCFCLQTELRSSFFLTSSRTMTG